MAKAKSKAKRHTKPPSQDQDVDAATKGWNPDLLRLQEQWEARKPRTRVAKVLSWLHKQKLRYDNMLGIPCFNTSEVIMLHCTLLLVTAFIVFGLYRNWLFLASRFASITVSPNL